MNTVLIPERLIKSRKLLGLNKAEAARLLNLSKMGYGRYESGERSPSFQTIVFIAQKFGTTAEYLTGKTDVPDAQVITIEREEEPDLFALANAFLFRNASLNTIRNCRISRKRTRAPYANTKASGFIAGRLIN